MTCQIGPRSRKPTPAKYPGISEDRSALSLPSLIASPVRCWTLVAALATPPYSSPREAVGFRFPSAADPCAPIRRARAKAVEQKLDAEFLVKNALTLADWDARFRTALDSGLFHVLSDEGRRRYVQGLAHVLQPAGQLFLMCFSDKEPGTEGPRRVSQKELRNAFDQGWDIESIDAVRVEVNPKFKEEFSEGGPKAWFAIVRRQ